MILMIDNYDSFTYNLVQYLRELGEKLVIKRNDEIDIEGIKKLSISRIVISPGPCTPKEAGITEECIKYFAGKKPILGVCLGHQAIAEVFGAQIVRAKHPVHGKTCKIFHDKKTIFENIKNPFIATRYHSLIVKNNTISKDIEISAKNEDGIIMGIRHKKYSIEGVQFHPEAILSECGKKLLSNFMRLK